MRPPRRPAPAVGRPRLLLEWLEAREVPATLVGLTTADTLVTFDSNTPGTTSAPVAINGINPATEDVVGIDYRLSTGQLYGVVLSSVAVGGNNARLVIIDPSSGTTTTVGNGLPTFNLTGASFGVDFNTLPDLLRVTGDDEQNLRIDPTTGTVVTTGGADTALAFDPTDDAGDDNDDANLGFFGPTPATGDPANTADVPTAAQTQITGAAYTRDPNTTGTGAPFFTTLYGIDTGNNGFDASGVRNAAGSADLLVIIGSPNGGQGQATAPTAQDSPNGGRVVVVGELRDAAFNPVDFGPNTGFDINTDTGEAFAVTTAAGGASTLYTIDLASAAVTPAGTGANPTGTIGSGLALRGLAVAPAATGAGTVQLSATSFTFPADRRPLPVTVTRTGGATGTVSVNYATSDGTAVAGVDYLPVSGMLTFGPGETTRTIFLQVPAGPASARPARTFNLTLSDAAGGATLGGNTTATITIPAVSTNPGSGETPAATPNRFFAVAAGAGGDGRVFVYDAATGAAVFNVSPFGAGFNLGMTVATADVNRDGFDDIIVGAGSGGGPRAVVIDGQTRAVAANFFAYDPSFRGGVNVAAGDVNGDGFADIILGSGDGGGPQVRVISGNGLTSESQTQLASFFAYDSEFRGGVNVGSGEYTGDGFADILTGAGNGGGPQVRIFNGRTLAPVASYFAYDGQFRGGVFVAGGDVGGDGRTDVVTGTGPGGGPNVRVFSGTGTTPTASFFAYTGTLNGGVRVATLFGSEASGRSPILTGAGVGGPSAVRFFDETGASAGADLDPLAGFTGGVFVG